MGALDVGADDRLDRARLDRIFAFRRRWWERIPIPGWLLGHWRWTRAARPDVQGIDAVLLARAPVPIEIWGDDPVVRRCVEATLCAIRQEMSWTNDRFRPADDAEIAFWSWRDGLDFAGVIVTIEERLGVTISDEDAIEMTRGTLGAFVAELTRRVRSASP